MKDIHKTDSMNQGSYVNANYNHENSTTIVNSRPSAFLSNDKYNRNNQLVLHQNGTQADATSSVYNVVSKTTAAESNAIRNDGENANLLSEKITGNILT